MQPLENSVRELDRAVMHLHTAILEEKHRPLPDMTTESCWDRIAERADKVLAITVALHSECTQQKEIA